MNSIALPKKVEFKKGDTANHAVAIVEPCYPGYGTTLGNSLRRVLLSSMPGAAVIGVKIKGASHEFMALPNVKEDVMEIILNLKELRLKVHSDEVVKLELEVIGEKEVKAKDITANSSVEIINPNLSIANITSMAGSLKMEIFVSQGKGYQTIESREEEKHETGYISMDSIFSPIVSVGMKVENARVGKMINWDKLSLDIVTDGTVTPEQAFNQSAQILIEQFQSLIKHEGDNKEDKHEEDNELENEQETKEKKSKKK